MVKAESCRLCLYIRMVYFSISTLMEKLLEDMLICLVSDLFI